MGFILRCAFWLSLALLIIPIDTGKQEEGRETIGPIQAAYAAREAVEDLAGLCGRKPDVCEAGRAAFHTISVRARESVRIAAELIDGENETAVAAGHKDGAAVAADGRSTDTGMTTGSVTRSN